MTCHRNLCSFCVCVFDRGSSKFLTGCSCDRKIAVREQKNKGGRGIDCERRRKGTKSIDWKRGHEKDMRLILLLRDGLSQQHIPVVKEGQNMNRGREDQTFDG